MTRTCGEDVDLEPSGPFARQTEMLGIGIGAANLVLDDIEQLLLDQV